jgi:hypothetical protein
LEVQTGVQTGTEESEKSGNSEDAEAEDPEHDPLLAEPPTAAHGVALTLTSRATLSTRGESSLEALARAPFGPLVLSLGPGAIAAAQGPARMLFFVGAALPGDDRSVEALLRFLPSQSGASLLALHAEGRRAGAPWELGLSADVGRLSLSAQAAPARAQALSLTSASASAEALRAAGLGLSLGLHGALGLCALSTAGAARPSLWLSPGTRAGQWPQRAAAGVVARLEQPGWAARLDAAYVLPAGAGRAFELTLSGERQWSAVSIGLEVAFARQSPEGVWLGRIALEVRWESG